MLHLDKYLLFLKRNTTFRYEIKRSERSGLIIIQYSAGISKKSFKVNSVRKILLFHASGEYSTLPIIFIPLEFQSIGKLPTKLFLHDDYRPERLDSIDSLYGSY